MIFLMDDDLRMGTPELITSPTALTACSTLGKPAMATVVGKSGASRMVAASGSSSRQRGSFFGSKPSGEYHAGHANDVMLSAVWEQRNRQAQLTFGDDPQSSLGADEHLGQVEPGGRFAA
jgi:hypothetical protein